VDKLEDYFHINGLKVNELYLLKLSIFWANSQEVETLFFNFLGGLDLAWLEFLGTIKGLQTPIGVFFGV